jgi:hypothetical protein
VLAKVCGDFGVLVLFCCCWHYFLFVVLVELLGLCMLLLLVALF